MQVEGEPVSVVPKDGLDGTAGNAAGVGVRGTSFFAPVSFGFLGGTDPTFSQGAGAYGQGPQQGVMGLATTDTGTGIYGGGTSKTYGGIGVRGETSSGVGVQGQSFGSGLAGKFIGNVLVTGTLTANQDIVLAGADCAEQFDVADEQQLEPGTVVVIDEEGAVRESRAAYDKKVAGVVSGGGDYKPGIVLDRRASNRNRTALALVGKVYCKVDAKYAPIEVGDLLTASPTPGHAMKAADPLRAFGAVVGKALRPLRSGTALIPVLVALQ